MHRVETRRFAAGAACLALCLSLPLLLAASQMHYRDVSLRDAVSKATAIVCAEFLGDDQAHHGAHRFRVGRVISGTGPAAGQEIHVFTLEAWAWSVVRQAERATGVRRSPLLDRLPAPPSAPLRPNAFYCLLLTRGPGQDYQLAVSGGHVAAPCAELAALATAPRPR